MSQQGSKQNSTDGSTASRAPPGKNVENVTKEKAASKTKEKPIVVMRKNRKRSQEVPVTNFNREGNNGLQEINPLLDIEEQKYKKEIKLSSDPNKLGSPMKLSKPDVALFIDEIGDIDICESRVSKVIQTSEADSKQEITHTDSFCGAIREIVNDQNYFSPDRSATLPRPRKSNESSQASERDAFFNGSAATIGDEPVQYSDSFNACGSHGNLANDNQNRYPINYNTRPPYSFDPRTHYSRYPPPQSSQQLPYPPTSPSRHRLPPSNIYYAVRPLYPGVSRFGPSPLGSCERLCGPAPFFGAHRYPLGYSTSKAPTSLPPSPKNQSQKVQDRTTVQTQTSFKTPSLTSASPISQMCQRETIKEPIPECKPLSSGIDETATSSRHSESLVLAPTTDMLSSVASVTPSTSKRSKPPLLRSTTSRSVSHPHDADVPISSTNSSYSSVSPPLPMPSLPSPRSPIARKLKRKSALFNTDALNSVFCLSCPPAGMDFSSSLAIKCLPTEDGEVSCTNFRL